MNDQKHYVRVKFKTFFNELWNDIHILFNNKLKKKFIGLLKLSALYTLLFYAKNFFKT